MNTATCGTSSLFFGLLKVKSVPVDEGSVLVDILR
jgi:hypothetical protein